MRWSERRTAVRSTFEMTSTLPLRATHALSAVAHLFLVRSMSRRGKLILLGGCIIAQSPCRGSPWRDVSQGYPRRQHHPAFRPIHTPRCQYRCSVDASHGGKFLLLAIHME